MQTVLKVLPACAGVLLFASSACAGDWYAGGSLGQVSSDVDSATVSRRLADQGLTGNASVSDTSHLGWRLVGGYEWNPYVALEGGYTRLGDIKMTVNSTTTLSTSQLKAVRPATGNGFEMSVLGKYPFNERVSGFARAGLFHWTQQYSLSPGGSGSFSGDDAVFGVGIEWRRDPRWSARLSWDRYTVAQDKTDFVALGIVYRFGAGTAAPVTEERVEPVPAPAVAEAPTAAAPAPAAAETSAPAPAAEAAPTPRVVQFAFKRTRLSGQASVIDEVAGYLAAHPAARVRITGYADNTGAEGFNPVLSRLRATAVADALAAKGVNRTRITVHGRGTAEPVADNRTRAGRQENRRAEIVIEGEAGSR